MAQKISQMTEQTTASMTETGTSDFLGGYTATGGNANRKFSLSGLANYFLNKFKMTLGGSSQTVKSAIDALNSKVHDFGNVGNGKTYAQIFEYVYPNLPDGAFIFSANSSGAKMFTGVKNGNYGAALYINFNGSWGRVINDNGTFSQS